ncbi:MAG: UvrB/UvrC motif-containing protein, partial [Pseudomonadota bacterium]
LIQTIGRAARNSEGVVIMYADSMTDSIRKAVDETGRRRKLQQEYNIANNITPETIRKTINDILSSMAEQDYVTVPIIEDDPMENVPLDAIPKLIERLTKEMFKAARDLEFEKAAELRDRIKGLENRHVRYA